MYERERPALVELRVHVNQQTLSDPRRLASLMAGVLRTFSGRMTQQIEIVDPNPKEDAMMQHAVKMTLQAMNSTHQMAGVRKASPIEGELLQRPEISGCPCGYCTISGPMAEAKAKVRRCPTCQRC
jgi:hypothetical protein